MRGFLKIGQDVTQRRKSEERLRNSEARLLLGALQHCVRNTLAVVRSIARRTATTSDPICRPMQDRHGRPGAFIAIRRAKIRGVSAILAGRTTGQAGPKSVKPPACWATEDALGRRDHVATGEPAR